MVQSLKALALHVAAITLESLALYMVPEHHQESLQSIESRIAKAPLGMDQKLN